MNRVATETAIRARINDSSILDEKARTSSCGNVAVSFPQETRRVMPLIAHEQTAGHAGRYNANRITSRYILCLRYTYTWPSSFESKLQCKSITSTTRPAASGETPRRSRTLREYLTVGRRYMHISDYESLLDDQDRHIQFHGTHFSIQFAATYRIPSIRCLTRPQALHEAKKLSLYLLGNEPESNFNYVALKFLRTVEDLFPNQKDVSSAYEGQEIDLVPGGKATKWTAPQKIHGEIKVDLLSNDNTPVVSILWKSTDTDFALIRRHHLLHYPVNKVSAQASKLQFKAIDGYLIIEMPDGTKWCIDDRPEAEKIISARLAIPSNLSSNDVSKLALELNKISSKVKVLHSPWDA